MDDRFYCMSELMIREYLKQWPWCWRELAQLLTDIAQENNQ